MTLHRITATGDIVNLKIVVRILKEGIQEKKKILAIAFESNLAFESWDLLLQSVAKSKGKKRCP